MAKIMLTCKSCGKEVEREEKPAPKNNKEARQIRFNCPCGATNLRDGSAVVAEKKAKKPVKPVKEPVPPAPDKSVKPEVPKEVIERSKANADEESASSPVIIQ